MSSRVPAPAASPTHPGRALCSGLSRGSQGGRRGGHLQRGPFRGRRESWSEERIPGLLGCRGLLRAACPVSASRRGPALLHGCSLLPFHFFSLFFLLPSLSSCKFPPQLHCRPRSCYHPKGQAAGLTSHTRYLPLLSQPDPTAAQEPGGQGGPQSVRQQGTTLIPLSLMGLSAPYQALHFIPAQESPVDFPTVHATPDPCHCLLRPGSRFSSWPEWAPVTDLTPDHFTWLVAHSTNRLLAISIPYYPFLFLLCSAAFLYLKG